MWTRWLLPYAVLTQLFYNIDNLCISGIRAVLLEGKAKDRNLRMLYRDICADTRNTKVIDIVKELREYGIEPVLVDQTADRAEAKRLYGVELQDMSAVKDVDALVIAVCHKEFEGLDQAAIESFFNPTNRLRKIHKKKEYSGSR